MNLYDYKLKETIELIAGAFTNVSDALTWLYSDNGWIKDGEGQGFSPNVAIDMGEYSQIVFAIKKRNEVIKSIKLKKGIDEYEGG